MLPTPVAALGDHGGPNQRSSSGRPGLQMAMQLWLGTPTAGTSTSGRSEQYEKGRTPNPQEFVRIFPTPTKRAWKTPSNCPNRQGAADIQTVTAMFPTPTTGAGLCGGTGNYQQLQRLCEDEIVTDEERRNMSQGNGGQLNPTWVEWLMGFPLGWTDIDMPAELPEKALNWWDVEPDVPRVATVVKNRVDRLKCLGNAVVPYQVYPILQAIHDIEMQNKQDKKQDAKK